MMRAALTLPLAAAGLLYGQARPTIESVTPVSAAAGTQNLNLIVTGANYSPEARVVWRFGALNATVLSTQFSPPSQLIAAVPAGLLASPGEVTIAVTRQIEGQVLVSNLATFTVVGGFSIQNTCPLPNAVVSVPYTATLVAAGGTPPYVWSVISGALPAGLQLAPGGTISGAATTVGQSTFTLQTADSGGRTTTLPCSLRVVSAAEGQTLAITSLSPNGVVAGPNDVRVEIRGVGFVTGAVAVLFSPGREQTDLATTFFAPNVITAVIPASRIQQPGDYTISVRQQGLAQFFSNAETFVVSAPLQFVTQCQLPDGGIGTPYSFRLGASGGFPPYRFALTDGALPGGLMLDPSGLIAGAATEAGNFQFGVSLTDNRGNTGSRACSLRMFGPIEAFPSELQLTPNAPQNLSITAAVPGTGVSVTVSTQSGGGWLRAVASAAGTPALVRVTAYSASLSPGSYSGQIVITGSGATNRMVTVPVRLTVPTIEASRLTARPAGLRFFTARSGRVPAPQGLLIGNPAPTPVAFNAASQAPWLSVAPASGSVQAGTDARLVVQANPAGFDPGTYAGEIVITSGALRTVVPVSLSVSASPEVLQLSRDGATLTAVAGGPPPTPRQFEILEGSAAFFWETTSPTGWTLSPASDASRPGLLSPVEITADSSGLSADVHQATIRVAAQAADNSPRLFTAALRLLGADAIPPPVPSAASLLFLAAPGTPASPRRLALRNLSRRAMTIDVQITGDSRPWTLDTTSRRVVPPGESRTIEVGVNLEGVAPGIYRSILAIQGTGSPRIHTVDLVLVFSPQGACTPSRLEILPVSLPGNFESAGGLAEDVEVQVRDNCGNPVSTGLVTADVPGAMLSLASLRDGRWAGSWSVPNTTGPAELRLAASSGALLGSLSILGTVTATPGVPYLAPDGVVSLPGFSAAPIASGGLLAAFGTGLATALQTAPGFPLPNGLSGTQLLIGENPVPLYFTSAGQINAQTLYNLRANVPHQVSVRAGSRWSNRVDIAVSVAQPVIFAATDVRGVPVSTDNPARRGDTIVVYCSGLGPVSGAVVAGGAAPSAELAAALLPVTVTIAGQPAAVGFAGLTPGLAGLYQVNVTVSTSAPAGDNVPLTVTAGGLTGSTAISVQ